MKKLLIILSIGIVSCHPKDDRKGIRHEIMHKMGDRIADYYYVTSDVKYDNGCASFTAYLDWSQSAQNYTICGSFTQKY